MKKDAPWNICNMSVGVERCFAGFSRNLFYEWERLDFLFEFSFDPAPARNGERRLNLPLPATSPMLPECHGFTLHAHSSGCANGGLRRCKMESWCCSTGPVSP